MGRSGVELASAPIRAMSKASGLVFDHWVVLCVIFAVLAMAFLIFQITWETRESRRLDELYRQALEERETDTAAPSPQANCTKRRSAPRSCFFCFPRKKSLANPSAPCYTTKYVCDHTN